MGKSEMGKSNSEDQRYLGNIGIIRKRRMRSMWSRTMGKAGGSRPVMSLFGGISKAPAIVIRTGRKDRCISSADVRAPILSNQEERRSAPWKLNEKCSLSHKYQ